MCQPDLLSMKFLEGTAAWKDTPCSIMFSWLPPAPWLRAERTLCCHELRRWAGLIIKESVAPGKNFIGR